MESNQTDERPDLDALSPSRPMSPALLLWVVGTMLFWARQENRLTTQSIASALVGGLLLAFASTIASRRRASTPQRVITACLFATIAWQTTLLVVSGWLDPYSLGIRDLPMLLLEGLVQGALRTLPFLPVPLVVYAFVARVGRCRGGTLTDG